MIDLNAEIPNENLTQKDTMQFLLHSTQHVATREELESVRNELKTEISKVETTLKQDILKVETTLKQDISKVEEKISKAETILKYDISKIEEKISKVDSKFDKIQWLIIATLLTVLLKDYVLSLLSTQH
jgi:molecular chaperone DnaK (HSP70)